MCSNPRAVLDGEAGHRSRPGRRQRNRMLATSGHSLIVVCSYECHLSHVLAATACRCTTTRSRCSCSSCRCSVASSPTHCSASSGARLLQPQVACVGRTCLGCSLLCSANEKCACQWQKRGRIALWFCACANRVCTVQDDCVAVAGPHDRQRRPLSDSAPECNHVSNQ